MFLCVHLCILEDLTVETATLPLINYFHDAHIVIKVQFNRNSRNVKQRKVCLYAYITSIYYL